MYLLVQAIYPSNMDQQKGPKINIFGPHLTIKKCWDSCDFLKPNDTGKKRFFAIKKEMLASKTGSYLVSSYEYSLKGLQFGEFSIFIFDLSTIILEELDLNHFSQGWFGFDAPEILIPIIRDYKIGRLLGKS